jgi:molecular chaperone HscB
LSSAAQPEEEESSSDILDSFRVLGVPRKFGLSEEELKQSYRRLMTEFHPDKHTNKPLPERERVDVIASQVTNAFQILRQPHTRAPHLLELLGTPMEETSRSDLVGMEFLMETMELREAVDSTSPVHLKPIWDETQQHIAQVVEDLETAFDEEDFARAVELSAQLQYWHNIETAIHEKMENE